MRTALVATLGSGAAAATIQTPESVAREFLTDTLAPLLATRGATAIVTVAPADARRAPAPCDHYTAFAPPGTRLSGKTLVGIRCADATPWQAFVSADIRVDAPSWQASRALRAGEVINDGDLVVASSPLSSVDVDAALASARGGSRPAQVRGLASLDGRMPAPVGRVVLRPVATGRALTAADVRDEGRINAGESVRVVYQGEGFSVTSEGRAVARPIPDRRSRSGSPAADWSTARCGAIIWSSCPAERQRPAVHAVHRAQVSSRSADRTLAQKPFHCVRAAPETDFLETAAHRPLETACRPPRGSTMKIENNRPLPSTESATAAKSGGTAAARPATVTSSVGSVNISETSRSLSTSSSNTEAPFDAKRVEAIKSAISAGHFKVNPEAVADKIVSSASQLLVGS